jgi:hypothetical protein
VVLVVSVADRVDGICTSIGKVSFPEEEEEDVLLI